MAIEENSSLLARTIRGEAVERTPVWAMRQAGRWDPEFRALRGDLDFFSFSENSELAAAASLCPRRFGVDGIILFYDITTLAVAMGQPFSLIPDRGPVPDRPIRSLADARRLIAKPDPSEYRSVLDTHRIVKNELAGELPTLVFAGAPFTLGAYQIGVGKDLTQVRRFIADQPEAWNALLETTTNATIEFLNHLMADGACACQLFDSWAGALDIEEYQRFAQSFHERIFAEVSGATILFVKDCPYLNLMAKTGADVISLGTGHNLATARMEYPELVFQGNVDHQLLVSGSPEDVGAAAKSCLAAGGKKRHILNLDHGMDRNARTECFAAFVDSART